jgi:putative redox protein
MKTRMIKCQFSNSRGQLISARIDYPADRALEEIDSFATFSHCFTCTKETITTFRLSRLLAEHGYAVLRFDFTGLGDSEGDFAETTFETTQDDLRCAVRFLQDNYHSPGFVMGHSLGGTTALSIAGEFDSINGVVTVASPSQPSHVLHHLDDALTMLEQGLPASFEVAGQLYTINPEFVDDVREFDMQDVLKTLHKPVLAFNIENDALVNAGNAWEIKKFTAGKVEIINIKNSDHLLSDRASTELVANEILKWMRIVSS